LREFKLDLVRKEGHEVSVMEHELSVKFKIPLFVEIFYSVIGSLI